MAADGLTRAVRTQLGLGRLLPLGGPADGVWLTERAAAGVLREAERAVPGTRLEGLRVGTLAPDGQDWGAARAANPAAPPTALPAAPLRIEADFAATADRPLPRTAELLRAALTAIAAHRIGLAVTEIDLRAVGLLDAEPAPRAVEEAGPGAAVAEPGPPPGGTHRADPLAAVVTAVPGVAALTPRLPDPVPSAEGAPPAIRVQIAVSGGHRVLDVGRAVRAAVTTAVGHAATAVVVTAVLPPGPASAPGA